LEKTSRDEYLLNCLKETEISKQQFVKYHYDKNLNKLTHKCCEDRYEKILHKNNVNFHSNHPSRGRPKEYSSCLSNFRMMANMSENDLQRKSLNLLKVSNSSNLRSGDTFFSNNFSGNSSNFGKTRGSYAQPGESKKFVYKIKKDRQSRKRKLQEMHQRQTQKEEEIIKHNEELANKLKQEKEEERVKQHQDMVTVVNFNIKF
jgi:hypothetical protein